MERISRNQLFAEMAKLVSKRSTCPKKQVGSVLIRNGRIIAIGYNGVLPGEDPMIGYNPETGETATVHAEANLISFCARNGIKTEGCELWVTLSPCVKCAELIIQSGIKTVIFLEPYRDTSSVKILKKQGIEVMHYTNDNFIIGW